MKITIKLFSILLTLLFCLTACSDQTEAQTTDSDADLPEPITLTADAFSAMHLSVSDADVYNDNAIVRRHSTESFTDSEAEQQRTVAIKGKDISVNYKESYINSSGDQLNQYQSEDENVTFRYYKASKKLRQITATKDYFSLPNDLESEEDYLTWIKELLKEYGVTDLSGYEYSCQTGVTVSGDDYAYGDTKDYFYRNYDPTCEKLSRYHFYYRRTVGNHLTSDCIEVCFFLTSGEVMVRFDQGQFTNVAKIELDETKMLETLDEYVKGCVDVEKYELLSYTVDHQTLTYVDGKLCNVYTVSLNLDPLAIPDIDSFTTLETIGIFCE